MPRPTVLGGGAYTKPNGYRFTFFPRFFLWPIFVYFAEKVNPRWLHTAQPFFSAFLGYKPRGASPRRDYVRREEDGISMNRIV